MSDKYITPNSFSTNNSVEVLDIELLNQHFMGDHEFKNVFLTLAVSEFEEGLQKINFYRDNLSLDGLYEFLHKLKGTVATVGFNNLTQEIAVAEQLAKSNINSSIRFEKIEQGLKRGLFLIKELI